MLIFHVFHVFFAFSFVIQFELVPSLQSVTREEYGPDVITSISSRFPERMVYACVFVCMCLCVSLWAKDKNHSNTKHSFSVVQ